MEALINFAYSGKIKIDSENVQSLLVGSSFLQLTEVREACGDFLKRRYLFIIIIKAELGLYMLFQII